jgi:hypothetical protein
MSADAFVAKPYESLAAPTAITLGTATRVHASGMGNSFAKMGVAGFAL